MKAVNRVADLIGKFCRYLTVALILFICVSILVQVVVRKAGGQISWVDEMTRYSFVLIVIFGSVNVVRGGQITITSFLHMLPKSVLRLVDGLIHVLVTAFSGVLTYAYYFAIGSNEGVTFAIVRQISVSHFYAVVTFGMALVTLMAALHTVEIFNGTIQYTKKEELAS